MIKISRRAFLQLLGAGVTVAALSELGFEVSTDAEVDAYQEWTTIGVCKLCPGGCGIKVRIVDGFPVKIEGSPHHPNNQGRVCPKANMGLQLLYSPDRLRTPMKRDGDTWTTISWDEAISTVVAKLREIQASPEELVFVDGDGRGQMHDLIAYFCRAFGTPNLVDTDSVNAGAAPLARYLMQGTRAAAGYNWEKMNYLLSFNGSLLEAWQPTVRNLRAYSYMRRGRVDQRVKIVQVEPRYSVTASKANEWIRIKPGTEGALAMGLAHVIVKERLYDREFVEQHTFGFEDWTAADGAEHIGFKTLVERDEYAPESVAAITGVPVEEIKRLAREFAAARPAVAAGEAGLSTHTNAVFTQMAISALNALVGSVNVPGGVLVQQDPPLTSFPKMDEVDKPRRDGAGSSDYPLATSVYHSLPEGNAAKVVFLHQANPVHDSPAPKRFRAMLEKADFVVSFASFVDESAELADLILPDSHYLEQWSEAALPPSLGYPVFSVGAPVIASLYDTMGAGDALLRIARGLGSAWKTSFPWDNFRELLRFRARGLFERNRGSITATSFDTFWEQLTKKGVWYDPTYHYGQWEEIFATPSGKYEFYSQTLQQRLEEVSAGSLEYTLIAAGITARGDEVYLPHYEPPRYAGEEGEFPLHLNVYWLMSLTGGRVSNTPWAQEILGLHVKEVWDSWVELNPETAARLGIADRDIVWVESPTGKLQTKARLYEGAMPDVVNIPLGLGHKAKGLRWAYNHGANPYEIIALEEDKLGGLAALLATRVKVYK